LKILLISPNTLTSPYPVYPIGLDYVAGSVPAGHEVRAVDLNVTPLPELDQLMEAFLPEIIGISCRNLDNTEMANSRSFVDEYADLVSRIRRRIDATIVIGGSGFNIMPQRLLEALGGDYGLMGEGERFGLLIEALAKDQDPLAVPGVITAKTPKKKAAPPPWSGDWSRQLIPGLHIPNFILSRGGC